MQTRHALCNERTHGHDPGMSLTAGSGPFGHQPKGRLNFTPPERVVYVEPWPRRVRAFVGERAIVDSERTVLVHESGRLARYAFPREDVLLDAETEPEVEGYVQVPWSSADRWLEEEQEIVVHPRDPFHRIEVLPSTRHVVVRAAGEIVAESLRPRILFETSLPPRYYFPLDDVRTDLLEPAALRTGCAYKGYASYWDVATSTESVPAAAWTYREPLREAEQVRDLVCFFQERPEIAVEVDGAPAEAPQTPWSGTGWIESARIG
jgi:uncharacterized protein (DUF427 family)